MEMKAIRESLTDEQIIKVVCALGSEEPRTDRQGHMRFQTVCHHGDSFNLCYFPDTKFFHCYTHCKENFDVFELVRRHFGFDGYGEAIKWIIATLGLRTDQADSEPSEIETSDEWDLFEKLQAYDEAEQRRLEPIPVLDESLLAFFGSPVAPREWLDDGISADVMYHYGIRVDSAHQRIIIPHRDIGGQLIGIRCRNYDPEMVDAGCKYTPATIEDAMYAHPLGRNLYGLYENKDTIMRLRKALVCESEKSVMQCATMYGADKNFCVATCGHQISPSQARLLQDIGVTELILGYDHDVDLSLGPNGEKNEVTMQFEQELLDVVRPYTSFFNISVLVDYKNTLGHKHSPTDDGREKLEALMRSKIRIPAVRAEDVLTDIRK